MISFMIAAGFLNGQDMIKILKQSEHDFCDGYCTEILCNVCSWRYSSEGHIFLLKSFFKNLLRNFVLM